MKLPRPLALLVALIVLSACSVAPAHDGRMVQAAQGVQPTISPSPTAPDEPQFRELGTFTRRRAMAHVRALAGDIGV
ncbi:MAG: hypothetical protein M3161_03600, partial [Actinomycetota bacterium]|nr:hypothetical protein [Actinomycetota bacterium]